MGLRNLSEFNPVLNIAEKEGKTFVVKYLATNKTFVKKREAILHTVEQVSDKVIYDIWGSAGLDRAIAMAKVNDVLHITFKGMKDTGAPQPMKEFNVQVEDPNVK